MERFMFSIWSWRIHAISIYAAMAYRSFDPVSNALGIRVRLPTAVEAASGSGGTATTKSMVLSKIDNSFIIFHIISSAW